MARIEQAIDRIMRWVLYACAAMLAVMVLIFGVQVVMRYFFSSALFWAEEAVRFLMIWMSLLGAAVVVWKRQHIVVDLFVAQLPTPTRRAVL